MTLHPDYPLPDTDDPIMAPFWAGCRGGRLLLQRDRVTGALVWPPKPAYWKGGARLEWIEASGRGAVYSYVVAQPPFLPAFAEQLPLILVLVQLDEGPRLVGYMVGITADNMRFGLPVRVVFKHLTDDVTLPVWAPA